MLDDDGAGLVGEVAEDVERVVRIRDVRLPGMLAGLQQLRHRGEVLARLQHLDVAEDEVAVDELVERGLLARVLAIAEPLLLAANRPRHLLVLEGLAALAVNERNLHFRRKMIGFNRLIGFLQVFHVYSSRF